MSDYTLDWDTTSADGVTTLSDGSGGTMDVSVSTPAGGTGAGEEWNHGTWIGDGDGELIASHVDDPTSTYIKFDGEVSDVTFELYDVDAGINWDDSVTVYAIDAHGNYVPVSFSDLGAYHTTSPSGDGGYTVDASGHDNPGVEGSGAPDSVTVNIAGPISGLIITYDNGESYGTSGVVGIGPIGFNEAPAPCFVRGTMIETKHGEIAVEDLVEGDLIRTADNGFQPLRWVGSTTVSAKGKMAPVLIKKGALGNSRDLMVSPAHRVVLQGWQTELLFGNDEMMAPAGALVNDRTITVQRSDKVEYFHLMFDKHEIIFSDGAATESFHPGEVSVGTMAKATRDEVLALFPELETNAAAYGPAARHTLKAHEVALMNG